MEKEECIICYNNTYLNILSCDHKICENCMFKLKPINETIYCPFCKFDITCDIFCSLCSMKLNSLCIHCNNSNSKEECVNIIGKCKHCLHMCCFLKWKNEYYFESEFIECPACFSVF